MRGRSGDLRPHEPKFLQWLALAPPPMQPKHMMQIALLPDFLHPHFEPKNTTQKLPSAELRGQCDDQPVR